MLMTVSKAAEELQTSVATIYRCIHAGAPCRRFGPSGRQYRVDPDQLLDWMNEIHHEESVIMDLTAMMDRRHALVR